MKDQARIIGSFAAVLCVGGVGACADELTRPLPERSASQLEQASEAVPVLVTTRPAGWPIENRYVVRLQDSVSRVREVVADLVEQEDRVLHFVYENAIRGFAATIPPGAVDEVRRDPRVRFVYRDVRLEGAWAAPSWGLDRIDQRALPLDSSYGPYGDGGLGVNVHIMDSGIHPGHSQFGSRVVTGPDSAFDAVRDTSNAFYAQDCWGQVEPGGTQVEESHGTPVAGIVGGSSYGVAPQVRLVSVRAGNCEGHWDLMEVMSATNWIAANFLAPAVVNYSGVVPSIEHDTAKTMFDEEMAALVDSGLTVVVAAGNDGDDACDYSPARISETITVGASTDDDERWAEGTGLTSGYGECVDLFAPGHGVVTAYPMDGSNQEDTDGTSVESGTSFAAPHVTGIVARYLASNPSATPAQVRSYVLDAATAAVLSNLGTGSPNLLAFTPRALSVEIDGPTSITEAGDYDWYALTDGGDYEYTYEWERRNKIGQSWGSWWTQGTDSMLTLSVTALDPEFQLRLTVDSDEQQDADTHGVTTFCDPCPEFFSLSSGASEADPAGEVR